MAEIDRKLKHPEEKQEHADARTIFAYALEMVLPEPALRRHVSIDNESNALLVAGRTFDLIKYNRIIVVRDRKDGATS